MRVETTLLLGRARSGGYAVGAFNVYSLEGIRAVVGAAEEVRSPVILQVLPAAIRFQGRALVAACIRAAEDAAVPVAVQLDHATTVGDVREGLRAGLRSVMADGSRLPFEDNVAFTREVAEIVHAVGGAVEGELGRLAGVEDGLAESGGQLTDPQEAGRFVAASGVDALAVCIGNVHGRTPQPPVLDFDRLRAIRERVTVPLVLHGASGLPDEAIRRAVRGGVCKVNVNTELQEAYLEALSGQPATNLLQLQRRAVERMQSVVTAKLRLLGSAGRA